MEAAADQAVSSMSQAKEAVAQGAARAQEMATDTMHAAREQMDVARQRAGEYLEQGRERASELGHTIEKSVRDRPLMTLLAAAGVGCLLGILLTRRD